MKKTILFLLVVLSLVLTSCGEKVIDRDLASHDAMKDLFPEMFTITEEECGHKYLFYLPIDGMNVDLPPDEFHYEYCINPNCAHKDAVVPHTDLWKIVTAEQAKKYEDGFSYHTMIFECVSCGKQIGMLMRCRAGVDDCAACYKPTFFDVYSLEDWKQIALGNKKMLGEIDGGDK